MAREVTELEAYVLVQDLDAVKSSHTFRSQTQVPKSNSSQYPNKFQAQMSTRKTYTNGKSIEKDTKGKGIEKEFFKIILTTKY